MKKYVALFLIAVTLLTLAACGSKDALAGTWSADLGDDGVITWTFNGKGKCTMENAYMKQDGTYTIDGDQLTVTLEAWSEPSTYTFSVDGSSLTMKENSGYGISGTFAKKISCTGAGANRNNEKCLRYALTFFAGTACYFC
ncbi:MAG: DUF5640 domain-containing protein [Oscillospiraceae bacterium]